MLHLFNFEPCGSVGGSDKKIGLRIRELERLYGIEYGGDRKSNDYKSRPKNSVLKNQNDSFDDKDTNNLELSFTQEDLATQLNMSVDTLQNYKILADMIPELDEMVKSQKVSKTTALAIIPDVKYTLM